MDKGETAETSAASQPSIIDGTAATAGGFLLDLIRDVSHLLSQDSTTYYTSISALRESTRYRTTWVIGETDAYLIHTQETTRTQVHVLHVDSVPADYAAAAQRVNQAADAAGKALDAAVLATELAVITRDEGSVPQKVLSSADFTAQHLFEGAVGTAMGTTLGPLCGPAVVICGPAFGYVGSEVGALVYEGVSDVVAAYIGLPGAISRASSDCHDRPLFAGGCLPYAGD